MGIGIFTLMKKAGKMVEFDQIDKIQRSIKHLVICNPEFMTYQAAATYINRSYGTVRNLVSEGILTPKKNGGFRYLRTADLDAFMEGKLQNGRIRIGKTGSIEKGTAAPNQVPQTQ